MEILSPAMHVPLMQPPSSAVNIIKNTAQDKQLMEEINNTLKQLERGDLPFYHKLVHSLNRSHEITKYYIILAHCPLLIKPDHRELLDAIFSFDWQKHDEAAILAYTNFLVHLNAAGTTHLVRTFESLIRNFNLVDRTNNRHSATQIARAYTHETLKKLLWIIPSSTTILWPILMDMFPHRALASEIQRTYTANLLHLVEYCPVLKDRVVSTIIDKLIQIDVEIKIEDLLADEEDKEDGAIFDVEMEHRQSEVEEMAEKMDQIMLVVVPYIEQQISDPKTQEEILAILLRAFDAIIVRTHRSKFTQFLIYLACRLEASFAHQFLNYLCHKLCYDNGPIYIRQTCAAYLGSFIGRAAFLSIVTVKEIITLLVTWGNKYLDLYGTEMPDAEKHALFYSVCQALFYLFCFKGRLLLEAGAKSFLKQLPIQRIIHSNLNPLKMCLPAVVREFSRLSKTFPQWDCASVMTKNKTLVLPTQTQFGGANKLDSFFPFDPYLLRRSSKYFNDGYQQWTGPEDEDEEYETEDEGSGHYHNGHTYNDTPSGYVSGFSSPQRSSLLARSPSRAIINSGNSSRHSSLNNSPLDMDMTSDDSYSNSSPLRKRSSLSISPSFRGSGSFERAQFLVEDMIEDEYN